MKSKVLSLAHKYGTRWDVGPEYILRHAELEVAGAAGVLRQIDAHLRKLKRLAVIQSPIEALREDEELGIRPNATLREIAENLDQVIVTMEGLVHLTGSTRGVIRLGLELLGLDQQGNPLPDVTGT